MMVQICVPRVASVMIRIHSVIYPSFSWRLSGQSSGVLFGILLDKWIVSSKCFRNPEALTVLKNWDRGQWQIEVVHPSFLLRFFEIVKFLLWEGKNVISVTCELSYRHSSLGFCFDCSGSNWGEVLVCSWFDFVGTIP